MTYDIQVLRYVHEVQERLGHILGRPKKQAWARRARQHCHATTKPDARAAFPLLSARNVTHLHT